MTRPRNRLVHADVDDVLALARLGDREAFGELFRRYRRFAHAVARAAGALDLDEAVSESFRLVASAIDAGSGPTVAFGPYLATTVRSVARRQHQLASRHDVVEPAALEAAIVSELQDTGDPVLAAAFASLPQRWQNVIWYVDVEGIPPRHAADLVGAPSSNAASALLLRARAGLRVAYIEALVGAGHTPEVRAHLAGLVSGGASTSELDETARWHLEQCPECRELEGRLAALLERRQARAMAVALVAMMGFAPDAELIPAGVGLGGFETVAGALNPSSWNWVSVAASGAAVAGVLLATAWLASGGDDGEAADPAPTVVSIAPTDRGRGEQPSDRPTTPSTSGLTTTTTRPASTSSSTTSSTTTSAAAPTTTLAEPAPPPPPPPPATAAPGTSPPTSIVDASPPESTPAPTTAPPDTTTTTTTVPVATTTTTTTIPPDAPVGHLGGSWTLLPNDVLRVELSVDRLTGEAGRIVFSAPMVFSNVNGASCSSPTECTFSGLVAPSTVSIVADTQVRSVTIQLFDSLGNLDDEGTAGQA